MSVIPVPPETMPHHIMLPARLDTKAAAALRDDLIVDDGTPLDGSEVTYLGGLCLQILLAGKREIINPSEKMAEALALFGVPFLLREPRTTSSET